MLAEEVLTVKVLGLDVTAEGAYHVAEWGHPAFFELMSLSYEGKELDLYYLTNNQIAAIELEIEERIRKHVDNRKKYL